MGVIRPPWIDKKWFTSCPFNYCDHFGDKNKLAKICRICRDEIDRIEEYRKKGEDPYDWNNVFKDVFEDLAITMQMISKQAAEMGIDLNNIDESEDYPEVDRKNNLTYKIVTHYGDEVSNILKILEIVPSDVDKTLIFKAADVLAHSRSYVGAKIYRALSSKLREDREPFDDLFDSKTSAFFAYIAVERNSRALLALSKHKPLREYKRKFLSLAKLSLEICDIIKTEFFPKDKLIYQEYGCDDYNF